MVIWVQFSNLGSFTLCVIFDYDIFLSESDDTDSFDNLATM